MKRVTNSTRKTFQIVCILFLFSCLTVSAQEKSWNVRAYLNPILARSPINYQEFQDNQITSDVIKRKTGAFWGAGIEVLKGMGNDLFVGGDVSFNSKGYVAKEQKYFGSQGGYSYQREDIVFMELKLLLEKHFLISDVNTLTVSSGLFYGKRPTIWGASLYGDDFGPNVSIGIIRDRIYGQLVFEKGLLDIKNDVRVVHFKTSILGIHMGYYF